MEVARLQARGESGDRLVCPWRSGTAEATALCLAVINQACLHVRGLPQQVQIEVSEVGARCVCAKGVRCVLRHAASPLPYAIHVTTQCAATPHNV